MLATKEEKGEELREKEIAVGGRQISIRNSVMFLLVALSPLIHRLLPDHDPRSVAASIA
jgi:hypothetical protein